MTSTAPSYAGAWPSLKPALSPWILSALEAQGFDSMTPVQASAIPLLLSHKDVVVEAVTGSGKTLAFCLPLLEIVMKKAGERQDGYIQAVVISPTRELAEQIFSVLSALLLACEEPQPPPLLLISDSTSSPSQDIKRFMESSSTIVVGTPGRTSEFLQSPAVKCSDVEILILDEADRLLDFGFTTTLTAILSRLPKQRRTGLFSATMTDALTQLVRVGLRNPVRVVVKTQSKTLTTSSERRTPAGLKNSYMIVSARERLYALLQLLKNEGKFVVYFDTCAAVDFFYRLLRQIDPKTSYHSLHGHLPTTARSNALAAFSTPIPEGETSVLLCTDVAARGIDLPDVEWVVQFDPPADPKVFSHRCGRTARAGRQGRAILFLQPGSEEAFIPFLQQRQIPLTLFELPDDAESSTKLEQLRRMAQEAVLKDRDLHDRSIKALPSHAKAYAKHEAKYIFRVQELDLIGSAWAWGMLQLPKMPELKSKTEIWDAGLAANLNWREYAYADKTREKQRLHKLEKSESRSTPLGKTSTSKIENHSTDVESHSSAEEESFIKKGAKVEFRSRRTADKLPAWSKQTSAQTVKELRRAKKDRKREHESKVRQEMMKGQVKVKVDSEDEGIDWKEDIQMRKKQRLQDMNRNKHVSGEGGFDGLS